MTCPPPLAQRNHKGWRSAPDAILRGHRWHASGSWQGHPRYTGTITTGGRGWPDTNATNEKSRCNDASLKHSKTQDLRETNWETTHFMVCQQTFQSSHKMDSGLRQTLVKIDFIHSITQMTTSNFAVWEIQHCIVDLDCSKTQTLLAALRIQNQPRGESYVLLEAEHLFPSVGCARNKRQYPTVRQNLKSFRWMLDCEWMDYLLSTSGTW